MGTWGSFPGVKRSKLDADYSPPSLGKRGHTFRFSYMSSWRGIPLRMTFLCLKPSIDNSDRTGFHIYESIITVTHGNEEKRDEDDNF
jgi:hypothetical protein